MERLSSFIKKAFSYPELLHATHPVTAISIIATSLLFAVYTFINSLNNYSNGSIYMEFFFCICMAVLYFSVFALCLESIRPNWSKPVKYVVWTAFGILSLLMGLILLDGSQRAHVRFFSTINDIRNRIGGIMVLAYTLGLIALALLLAMYFSYSHDVHQKFNSHILNINSKLFFTSIIYGVIQLGVIFLTLIVSLLLYEDAFKFLPTVLVLINGLFYAPAIVYAISHENEDANMFIQVIVRYIMLVISLIGFAIIYIYIIKLVVTASVPSNSVYGILTALFVEAMFISYMCTTFEEKGFLQKFAYNCPLIFAPFILMQCYTIIVRIGQYGLTPKRYFGVAFILFEIVYIFYYTVMHKREHEIAGRNILLILCAFIIVVIFIPGISAKPLSTTLARHTLASYLERSQQSAEISDREYMRANAAYGFLSDDDFGEGRLTKYFQAIDQDTLRTLREKSKEAAKRFTDSEDSDTASLLSERYGSFYTDINSLTAEHYTDISSYSRLLHVKIRDRKGYNADNSNPIDPSKLFVFMYDYDLDTENPVEEYPTVDLTDFSRKFTDLCIDLDNNVITDDEFNSSCRSMCVIDINENIRLLITEADITRNVKDETVAFNMEAFMLIR